MCLLVCVEAVFAVALLDVGGRWHKMMKEQNGGSLQKPTRAALCEIRLVNWNETGRMCHALYVQPLTVWIVTSSPQDEVSVTAILHFCHG